MPVAIRPFTPADEDRVAEGFLALNRFEEPLARNRRLDPAAGHELLRLALARVAEEGGAALVAELDGKVVGHLVVLRQEDGPYVRAELRPHAYIAELFVREEARRHGVGRALMAAAEAWARGQGLTRLMVGVLAGNAGAATLYAGLGFTPHAVELEKALPPEGR